MIRRIAVASTLLCLLPLQTAVSAAAPPVTQAAAGTLAATAPGKPEWEPDPPTYGSTVVEGMRIPMSDGVELVADIVYPTDLDSGEQAAGPFPVLLSQGPYFCDTSQGNLTAFGSDWSPYVTRGYLVAAACVRGTGRSGGNFGFLGPRDQLDGVELVDWAAEDLPRSNGKVGLAGGSYPALAQMFTAGAVRSSALKAIAPAAAGAELYRATFLTGGVPTETTAEYLPGLTALGGPRAGATGTDLAAEIERGGPRAYDGEYWETRTPGRMAQAIADNDIPVLLWSGYGDIYTRGSLEMYTYLQNAHAGRPVYGPMDASQPASPRYQLIMGPGGHGVDVKLSGLLQWYDTWLKDRDTPMRTTSTPLHMYSLGSQNWVNTSAYPLTDAYTPYYLGEAGALTTNPPEKRGSDTLQYTQPSAPGGQVTYTSQPFRDGATLAGPISATVYASTTGRNLHVITELQDVAEDGTATKLTSGNQVASLRALEPGRSWTDPAGVMVRPYGSFDEDDYLEPGEVARLDVALSPRVAVLAPGHSLRLIVTTQMDPSDCAPLLGVNPCFPTATQLQTLPGTYSLARGSAHASSLNLPLLPRTCLPANGGIGDQPEPVRGTPRSAATPCQAPTGPASPDARNGSPSLGDNTPGRAPSRGAPQKEALAATGSGTTLPLLALLALTAGLGASRRRARSIHTDVHTRS